jgi:hypothetical protein
MDRAIPAQKEARRNITPGKSQSKRDITNGNQTPIDLYPLHSEAANLKNTGFCRHPGPTGMKTGILAVAKSVERLTNTLPVIAMPPGGQRCVMPSRWGGRLEVTA